MLRRFNSSLKEQNLKLLQEAFLCQCALLVNSFLLYESFHSEFVWYQVNELLHLCTVENKLLCFVLGDMDSLLEHRLVKIIIFVVNIKAC